VGQAVDGETPGVALLFEHDQQGLAPSIGPLYPQRHIELPKSLTEAFLELLLAHGCNAHLLVDLRGFGGGEEWYRIGVGIDETKSKRMPRR